MKMVNNVLGADVFAISRIPIQSPRSTKIGEVDPRYAAPPPERPTQVRHHHHHHHHHHHAKDVAVAVVEREDERVVQYSQIDSIGVSGDKKGLHWYQ